MDSETVPSKNKNSKLTKTLLAGLLLSGILLMASLVSYPHQLAFAHDSGWHDFCFEETTLAFDFLVELVPAAFPLTKILVAILAWILGVALVTVACKPQLIPPQPVLNTVECNTIENGVGGFRGDPDKSDFFFDDTNGGQIDPITGEVTESLTGVGSNAPTGLFVFNTFDEEGERVGLGVIHRISPLFLLAHLLLIFTLNLIPGIGFLLAAAAGVFNYKFWMDLSDPTGGHAAHPTKPIKNIESNKTPDDFYPLGGNEIKFKAIDKLNYEDEAVFKFNVVDNGYPDIEFEQDPVIIEANSHFGFTASSVTLGKFGQINGVDDCDPNPKITYKGDSFYPLQIIGGNKNATWQVSEHVSGIKKWPETNESQSLMSEILDELPGVTVDAGKLFFQSPEDSRQILKKHKVSPETFSAKYKNLVKQQEVKIQKLKDQIDLFRGNTLPEAQANKVATIDGLEKKLASAEDELVTMKSFDPKKVAIGGKLASLVIAASFTFFTDSSGTEINQVDDNSNLSVNRNQTVIVVDTLPPDILVLEHKAIEIPVNQNMASDVTVSTPLVFDVADPFPTLTHNATGVFEESEGSSIVGDFPLGVTKIAWNATDFSGNQSPFAIQIVNVKKEGTNIPSTAFNQTVPLTFTDFPTDITLNSTNPDEDPLTFLIEENPENGVILSPIEAIFQNKFQLKGTVSRLQGLAVDSEEIVFLTDSENDRILTLDSNGVLDIAFDTNQISEKPEAISLIEPDTFLVSDWNNQTIAEANSQGELLEKIDLSSLFASGTISDPKFIDKNNKKLYITDSGKGNLVILENDKAFGNPTKLKNPKGLALIGDSLFVADSGNQRILRFDNEVFTNQFGESGQNDGQFSNLNGISINSTKLFASDTDNHRVQTFDLFGNHLMNIGTGIEGNGTDQFSYPNDVNTNSTHIFVSDSNNNRIQIFNASGVYKQTIGTGIEGNGTNQFSFPKGLANNGTHIFVADSNNNRIQIFNASLGFELSLGSGEADSSDGNFNSPSGIYHNGTHTFVADTGNNRVQVFDSQGQFVSKFGSVANLKEPSDIVTNNFSEIYVSDSDGNRIQIFDSHGALVGSIDSKISSGLSQQVTLIPLFVADLQADSLDFDNDDNLLVADWNQERIVKFILGGGEITEIDLTELFNDEPSLDPQNIAIDSSDNIYITDKTNQKIHVLDALGQPIQIIDLSGISVNPVGIAIDDSDNIFVSDWEVDSEKIVRVDTGGNLIGEPFELSNVFSNPQDIAYNGTHYWILDDKLDPQNKKIIQFEDTKGIEETFDIFSSDANTIGISFRLNTDDKNILFSNQTAGKIFDLDIETHEVNEFADIGGDPELVGITKNTKKSRFLGEFIENNSGDLEKPTGITIGPDQNFYVSSTSDNSIKKFNGTSGEYLADFVLPTKDKDVDSLSSPRDLVFGPDLNLYVASFDTDSIKKFNGISGEYMEDFVTPSSGGLDGPIGFAFHPITGDLLVGSGINHNILRFNGTDGSFIEYFVPSSDNTGLISPQSMAIGPDLNLYVVSRGTDRILKFDINNGSFLGNFTSQGQLSKPSGIAFDFVKGFLYSTSQGEFLDEIIKFNSTTGELINKISNGEVDRPQSLAVGLNSDVYVSGFSNNAVFRYGVPTSSIFLGDWKNNNQQIVGLNSTGHQVPMVGFSQDEVNSELRNPGYMATDSLGDIWITDVQANKGKLVKFDGGVGSLKEIIELSDIPLTPISQTMNTTLSNGTTIEIDSKGNMVKKDGPTTISIIPEALTIDSSDNFYVGDWMEERIVKLNFDGTFLDIFKLNSTFNDPEDIVLEETEQGTKIYVADKESGELLKIDTDKTLHEIDLEQDHDIVKGITNFENSVYFTSTSVGQGGKIFKMNQTEFIEPVTDIIVEPQGVAVADQDSIYLSDWKDERIVEIDSSGMKKSVYDLGFANFLDLEKLRDIDVQEEAGFVEFWLADSRKAEIQKISTFTNKTESQQSVADKFVFMSSLAVDAENNFYVTSTENATFNKFTERGSLLQEIPVDEDRFLIDVSTQEILDSIFVFLSLGNPPEIQKFDSELNILDSTTVNGPITSVASSKNGNIFVGHPNNTISKFSKDFALLTPLTINQPEAAISDLVIDNDNNLFAADIAQNRIHKFNLTSGEYIGWLGKCDTGAGCDLNDNHTKGYTDDADSLGFTDGSDFGQFFEPSDITVDRTGNIFVADIQIKDDLNSPRIQKFSNTGYFIENFLSNSSNSMVKGNFNNTQSIAVGSNFFYVADVEKLHFFDVNPFSPISIDPDTKITSSNVTYRSNPEFPTQPAPPLQATNIGFDNFKFKVTDGFDESNIGIVNVTVASPDIDRDGIFFNVDVDPIEFSVNFLDSLNPTQITGGSIEDYGDQVISIQNSREPEKGVFIQADVTPKVNVDPQHGVIKACDGSIEILLNPGNRLNLTCENGGLVESIRGNIQVVFFDSFGRNATSKIGVGNSLHFSPLNFAFSASEDNNDVVSPTLNFNSKSKTYSIAPGQEVVADTASPDLDQDTCSTPLILEAEIIQGIDSTDTSTTNQLPKINEFLNLMIEDIDNGSPKTTEGKILSTTNNYTSTNQNILPKGTTTVLFEAIDDTGNMAECSSTITVQDTTSPSISFAQDTITVQTPFYDDVAIVNFDTGTTRDLPVNISDPPNHVGRILDDDNHKPQCILPSGSTFVLGENPVGCIANDESENSRPGSGNFTINVIPGSSDVFIHSLNAYNKKGPQGLSNGDVIRVGFSQPTNKPNAFEKAQIDNLLEFTKADGITPVSLGLNYSGTFITPSLLEIALTDLTGANFEISDTVFKIKPDSGLENSAGTFGHSLLASPIMTGSFNSNAPPVITAFIADDPDLKNTFEEGDDPLDDIRYSLEDTLTIRFSDPTNKPGGSTTLDKQTVDSIFVFNSTGGSQIFPGNDYTGEWVNALTFVITIKELNTLLSNDPVPGDTIVTVREEANLKNKSGISPNSISTSNPLLGSFGPFTIVKKIEPQGSATTVLPSGITVGMTFPDGIENVSIGKSMLDGSDGRGRFLLLGDTIEIKASKENACVNGCDLEFTFSPEDLAQHGIELYKLRIFHDENDNEVFDHNEILVPEISSSPDQGPITAKVTVFKNSLFGIGEDIHSGGGGSGDSTSPVFESASMGGGGSLIPLDDIHFENDVEKTILHVGEEYTLKISLYENSGPDALQHISLYTDLHGFEREIHHSEAYIRYDKGIGTSTFDPQGLFRDSDISITQNDSQLEIEFSLVFDKPMAESDIIVRAWDTKRNFADIRFSEAIEVIPEEPPGILDDSLDDIIADSEGNILLDFETFEKWAGYSGEIISDAELLEMLNIDGNYIPEWYKNFVIQWVHDKVISFTEFVNALKFFASQNTLT